MANRTTKQNRTHLRRRMEEQSPKPKRITTQCFTCPLFGGGKQKETTHPPFTPERDDAHITAGRQLPGPPPAEEGTDAPTAADGNLSNEDAIAEADVPAAAVASNDARRTSSKPDSAMDGRTAPRTNSADPDAAPRGHSNGSNQFSETGNVGDEPPLTAMGEQQTHSDHSADIETASAVSAHQNAQIEALQKQLSQQAELIAAEQRWSDL